MCGPTCANPSDDPTTCEECCAGLQVSEKQKTNAKSNVISNPDDRHCCHQDRHQDILLSTQASLDQLVDPRTIDAIVARFIVSINNITNVNSTKNINNIAINVNTIAIILTRFVASDFCSTIPDERCPEFLEAVLREGIPVLAEADNPDTYPQVFKTCQDNIFKLPNFPSTVTSFHEMPTFLKIKQILFQFCNFVLPGTCPEKRRLL